MASVRATRLSLRVAMLVAGVVLTVSSVGCVMPAGYNPGQLDLQKYKHVTIQMFDVAPEVTMPPEMNQRMCESAKASLAKKAQFGNVCVGECQGKEEELVLTGVMKVYDPGSQMGRLLLFLAGPAHVKADVCLKDGATGECLNTTEVSSVFALGGLVGGMVSAENIVDAFGAAIGNGLAEAKKRSKPMD